MDKLLNQTFLRFLARFVIIILIGVFGALVIGQVTSDENRATPVEIQD